MSGIPALFNIRTAIGRQAWIDQANNRIGTAAPAVHRPALERTSRGLLDRGITTLIVDSLEIDQQSERWRSQSFGLIIAETVNAGRAIRMRHRSENLCARRHGTAVSIHPLAQLM